ncbi:MAG: hypothetical protein ACLP56_05385 [Candidatus Sulfotelmatobacter sp.]
MQSSKKNSQYNKASKLRAEADRRAQAEWEREEQRARKKAKQAGPKP